MIWPLAKIADDLNQSKNKVYKLLAGLKNAFYTCLIDFWLAGWRNVPPDRMPSYKWHFLAIFFHYVFTFREVEQFCSKFRVYWRSSQFVPLLHHMLRLPLKLHITTIIRERCFFRLVTSVGQRKNSESSWGIEPQTFEFRAPMLYHWATETPRSVKKFIWNASRVC